MFGRAQLEKGYRGSLEHSIVKDLKKRRAKFEYETLKIRWEEIMYRSYTPDFILRNGIIIEAKGRFLPRERVRAIAIKKQFPYLDIRFVFSNSNAKIYKILMYFMVIYYISLKKLRIFLILPLRNPLC